MRNACAAAIRRASVGVATVAVSLVAMMGLGVAAAAACTWEANPTPGTNLFVHPSQSESSQRVGTLHSGEEFFGACSRNANGWIAVTPGQWTETYTGVAPFDWVNGAFAVKL
jgi:hypothetical protein